MLRRLLALFLLLLSLSSCTGDAPTARSLFDRFSSLYPLEAGVTYDSEAPKGDAAYLDRLLFAALYRRADGSYDGEDIESLVLYLGASGKEHRELAIFRCHGRDSAREVALLCAARAEFLLKTLGVKARVLRSGEIVVLIALSDNAKAQRLLLKLLR